MEELKQNRTRKTSSSSSFSSVTVKKSGVEWIIVERAGRDFNETLINLPFYFVRCY